MIDFVEKFGLNRNDVGNLIEAYSSYADYAALSDEYRQEFKRIYSASCYTLAALFQSIMEPKRSKIYFEKAALIYKELNWPYWHLCQICSNGNEEIPIKQRTGNIESDFYSLLHYANSTLDYYSNEDLMMWPGLIPKLNIPYRVVSSQLVEESNLVGKHNLLYSIHTVLEAVTEEISIYKLDPHWHQLSGPIVPYEPVMLATTIVLLKRWLITGSFKSLLVMLGVQNTLGHALLEIAYEIVSNENNLEYI